MPRSSVLLSLAVTGALTGALAACDATRPTRPGTPADAAARAEPSDPTPSAITLEKIGEYAGGGAGAAEITAYDAVTRRLFVVNGALGTVDVLDLRDPSSPTRIASLSVAAWGAAANSVAAEGGVVAVAVEAHDKTAPGTVVLYRAATLAPVSTVVVGAQPDMLTFTPDGRHVVVANEGEPNDAYTVDPEGSVSIIDVHNVNRPTVRTATFGAFDARRAELLGKGVRIYGPNARVAQDLEPEYVAIDPDGRTAWVTLQENNALAKVDLASATVLDVLPLGYKDHSAPGRGLDASDRDDAVNIRPWPVRGMYQPDAIAAWRSGGRTWLVTANEGDARDWAGLREEARVASLPLEPTIFTAAACGGPCTAAARLGRLTVTNQLGRNPVTGRFDALYVLGGRSISVWSDAGAQVWDSGDEMERRTAALPNARFNASNSNDAFDDRSDNKGPEPEGVVLGRLGTKTFAFVGLERIGGVMVWDVTDPEHPRYETYVNTRFGAAGDLGPEGVTFIPAVRSPSREPLVIVGNEVSGTTAVYAVRLR